MASSTGQPLRYRGSRHSRSSCDTLEIEAARLAATRHTAKDLCRLRTLLAERGGRNDAQGTEGFVDIAGNLAWVETCRIVSGHIKETIASTLTERLTEPDDKAHHAIVDAIASRDPQRAATTARASMRPMNEALAPSTR